MHRPFSSQTHVHARTEAHMCMFATCDEMVSGMGCLAASVMTFLLRVFMSLHMQALARQMLHIHSAISQANSPQKCCRRFTGDCRLENFGSFLKSRLLHQEPVVSAKNCSRATCLPNNCVLFTGDYRQSMF